MHKYLYLACLMFFFGSRELYAASTDCVGIVSGLERLACFDKGAGTPALDEPLRDLPPSSETFARLAANERQRDPEQLGFVMSTGPEMPGSEQQRVFISAPAVTALDDGRYLMISCQADISRLQLLLERPIKRHSVTVQLQVDGGAVAPARSWRVLEDGRVIDAGRGLPAVELIRRLGQGSRITVRSDDPGLNAMVFDAVGLAAMIEEERRACHW